MAAETAIGEGFDGLMEGKKPKSAVCLFVPQLEGVIGQIDEGVDLGVKIADALVVRQRQQAGAGGIDIGVRRQFGNLFRFFGLLPLALRHDAIIAEAEQRRGADTTRMPERD